MAHAFLSPSGMPAALLCNAKVYREKDIPDHPNESAAEGTAAHFLLEQCLLQNCNAAEFIGCYIDVGEKVQFRTSGNWPVNADMAREVQKALDVLHSLADGATIYPEQTLDISFITGEEGATGTSDVVVIKGNTAVIADLKYGRGVQVFAEGNEQLLMYGASAVKDFDPLGEVEFVELHILQPRLNHFDVWKLSVAEMNERIAVIREASHRILAGPEGLTAVPGEKQCKFCKAKATCEENREHLLGTVVEGFLDLDKGFVKVEMPQAEKLLAQAFGVKPAAITFHHAGDDEADDFHAEHFTVKKPNIRPSLEEAEAKLVDASDERLATLMDAADSLEGFVKALRAETERRLLAGKFTDPRYKLVEGRQGARSWTNEAEAEATLKAMRLKVDQMYDFKLISPTTAEKLLSETNKRKWAKLQPLITRSDGKPSVAPASDKRPALSMAIAEQFEELPAEQPVMVAEDTFEDLV